jgi:hypothetical protein
LITMLLLPISSVWPSRLCSAAATPMALPAPGLFSTITAWPSCGASTSASTRAEPSAPPPGAKGTMMRSGLVGQASAAPAARGSPPTAAKAGQRQHICERGLKAFVATAARGGSVGHVFASAFFGSCEIRRS